LRFNDALIGAALLLLAASILFMTRNYPEMPGQPLLTLWIARFRNGRVLSSLVVAVIACLVIDYAFRRILLVPLPLGPLAGVIW
jgi:hypothetical protein